MFTLSCEGMFKYFKKRFTDSAQAKATPRCLKHCRGASFWQIFLQKIYSYWPLMDTQTLSTQLQCLVTKGQSNMIQENFLAVFLIRSGRIRTDSGFFMDPDPVLNFTPQSGGKQAVRPWTNTVVCLPKQEENTFGLVIYKKLYYSQANKCSYCTVHKIQMNLLQQYIYV